MFLVKAYLPVNESFGMLFFYLACCLILHRSFMAYDSNVFNAMPSV